MITIDLAGLADRVGQEIGTSDWMVVSQEQISNFADATGDHQWIHVDWRARRPRRRSSRRSRTGS